MDRVKGFLKNLIRDPYFLGFLSLLWLLFRSGTKPSRITYPCQRASATISFHLLIYPLLMLIFIFLKKFLKISTRAQGVSGRKVLSVFLASLSAVVTVLTVYANILINPGAVLSERAASAGRKTTVSLIRVNGGSLEESLREAINFIGGIDYYIPPRSKVLIKPNIVRNQEPPDTTDPAIVEALINIIRRKNPSVIWIHRG